jgi:hypothetical protein
MFYRVGPQGPFFGMKSGLVLCEAPGHKVESSWILRLNRFVRMNYMLNSVGDLCDGDRAYVTSAAARLARAGTIAGNSKQEEFFRRDFY